MTDANLPVSGLIPDSITQEVNRHFSQSARTYRQGAQLQFEVGEALLERLQPNGKSVCLDLGCGPGLFSLPLKQAFSQLVSLDLSVNMLQANVEAGTRVQGDCHALPICGNSIDAVYSSLMVQWCDLPKVLKEIHRVLQVGGQAVISTLIQGSLFELEAAWQTVDSDTHIHDYLSLAQVEASLDEKDWADVRIDTVTHTYWFDRATSLAKELKLLGANFVKRRERKGLTPKSNWLAMEAAYREKFYNKSRVGIPASYRVVYLNLTKSERV